MRTQIVAGILGKMLCAFALVMILPLFYAVAQQETIYTSFILSMCITGMIGLLLIFYGEVGGHIGAREGFLIVSGIWFLASVLGALPYWLSGIVPSYLDAVFETVSGLTTTGASVISDVEVLPGSLLLWRSLTHWLGGMGIIVLFLVFLTNLGADAVNLFKAESPGPTVERIMPRIRHMAITLWSLYVIFTIVQIILLYLAGMTMFDAINHAFATMATGGFSTKNSSIKYYDNFTIELIIIFFMFFAGGNFGLYYLVWKRGYRRLIQDIEFKLYFGIVALSTITIALFLYYQSSVPFSMGLRDALFTVVSIMTTTGFATADFDQWPPVTKMILFILMFLGGCAGSTAGGIKVIRIIILMKDAVSSLLRAIHPKIVRTVKVDGKAIDFSVLYAILQFFFLYILIFFISVMLVSATGMEPFDAMSAVVATLSNVGPGFGVVGPTTTFFQVHPFAKIVLIIDMLLGRLELFTVLVLLHPEFWQPYMARKNFFPSLRKLSNQRTSFKNW